MSPTKQERDHVSFEEAQKYFREGQVLLFRPRKLPWWKYFWPLNWFGYLICALGRTEYCHAATLVELRFSWYAVEMVEGIGGRIHPLSRYLNELGPDTIDVYGVTSSRYYSPFAVTRMINFVGTSYGLWSVVVSALCHFPISRWLIKAFTNETNQNDDKATTDRASYCSAAVSEALRHGGIDPVPNMCDAHTEPGDLGRSSSLNYMFTLKPDKELLR